MIKRDYYYENERILEIFKSIINEGVSNKRKFIAAGIFITIITIVICLLIYLMENTEPGKGLNIISVASAILGVGSFIGFIIFMLKEDNRKYRYFNIQEEKLKEGLKIRTTSKVMYHNDRNDKFENELINNDILTGTYVEKDIRIIDFHIKKGVDFISEREVQPLFLRGSVAFFILFITIAVQIAIVFFQYYEKLNSLFFAISVLIILFSISIYSIIYMVSSFYRDINNRKIASLKFMIKHLEIIKLKRIHMLEENDKAKKTSKIRQMIDILIN